MAPPSPGSEPAAHGHGRLGRRIRWWILNRDGRGLVGRRLRRVIVRKLGILVPVVAGRCLHHRHDSLIPKVNDPAVGIAEAATPSAYALTVSVSPLYPIVRQDAVTPPQNDACARSSSTTARSHR